MKYFSRNIENKLKYLAKSYPVLVISGPRQSGKSTLVKQLMALEIKSSKTFNKSFLTNLDHFHQLAKTDIHSQYLVYGGQGLQKQKIGKTQILSWKELHHLP